MTQRGDGHPHAVCPRLAPWCGTLVALVSYGCAQPPVTAICPSRTWTLSAEASADSVLDVLFVIDDSASMVDQEAWLRAELARVIAMLTTGDRDGDGTSDYLPPPSLHVGVLPARIADASGSCGTSASEGIIAWRAIGEDLDADVVAAIEEAVRITDLGTSGCGLEQPLEAALRALSPSRYRSGLAPDYEPPPVPAGTLLRGDAENDGFLREDSTLDIVVITDEDDCSHVDLFADDPTSDDGSRGCDESVADLERYRSGFLALRRSPSMVGLGVVAGVPADLPQRGATMEEMLADPRMAARVDADGALLPACAGAAGSATPGRRLVELARLLRDSGAISRVHSACTPNIRQIFDWTAALSFSDLSGVCLPEQVDGVECDVSVLLPTMTSLPYPDRCAELDLEADGIESTRDGPRERCTLPRLETFDGSRAGWYYDTESPTARDLCASRAWLALRAVSSVLGVRVEVRCEVPVPPGGPPVPEECVL